MLRIALLVITCLFSSSLLAQRDFGAPLSSSEITKIIQLAPVRSPQQIPFDVNSSTTETTINIHTTVDAGHVTIIDPSGIIIPSSGSDESNEGVSGWLYLLMGFITEEDHEQVKINNPAAGKWFLNISPPSDSSATGWISITQKGTLLVRADVSRLIYSAGDPVVISVEAFDSGNAVLGADVVANVYQQEAKLSTQTIVLHDDGAAPDIHKNDGLYTGQISGLPLGYYRVDATFQHDASRIESHTNFRIAPLLGVITNHVTDTGVDTNGDGLFERIDVNFEVDINMPGSYSLAAELKHGDKTILKGTQLELSTGLHKLAISFLKKDIKKYLSNDGPYEISDVRLIRNANTNLTQRTRMADRRTDLGFTQAYKLQQLQRPLTVILDGFTETTQDTNGNGKLDVLNVELQVDVLQTGTYTWSGSIQAPDGTAVASASNSGALNVIGLNNISLSFNGEAIGASGLNGPYVISGFGIYGPPNAAALKLKIGKTSGYTCDQFEGYKGQYQKTNLPDSGPIILKTRH